jgi:hypothetical protein
MIETGNYIYEDVLENRKEKIIKILLSEINFLKCKENIENDAYQKALGKLEYLLNTLNDNKNKLSDDEFDKLVSLIYNIYRALTLE